MCVIKLKVDFIALRQFLSLTATKIWYNIFYSKFKISCKLAVSFVMCFYVREYHKVKESTCFQAFRTFAAILDLRECKQQRNCLKMKKKDEKTKERNQIKLQNL